MGREPVPLRRRPIARVRRARQEVSRTFMSDAADVILVAHPVHADIPEDDMRAAIATTWIVRGVVEVKPARLTFEATRNADWTALARGQAREWREKVVPLLERYPQAMIVYFGLAPIPLAL